MHKKHSDMQNLIVALVISMLIMGYWQYFIENPRREQEVLTERLKAQSQQITRKEDNSELFKSREELLAESPRITVKSDRLHGSIALKGLRFDELALVKYHETLNPDSPEVTLFSPAKGKDSYYTEIGWLPADSGSIVVPSKDTLWSSDSKELTPEHPVTLTWNNGGGVTFKVKVALDENYMFTISTSATDAAGKPADVQNYASINRVYDIKSHPALGILHEGPIGVFDGILHETPYKKLSEQKEESYHSQSGWFGITDKYWLAALVLPHGECSSQYLYDGRDGRDHFQVQYLKTDKGDTELRLFAGAKEMAILDDYEARYNIPLFDHAVDLGLFDFLTKPILKTLTYFYGLTGNFGIAILLLTVIVKLFMYPLASKSFRSMNQMKKLQPKILEIRERYKEDKLKINQEMMELYKREKVNPASGCLPMFIQIPVFFSLYKVLYVTLEMRQAPFFGWIHDLSAPDPTNLFTLFGLLHWSPPTFMHLGIWPMIMALTMFIQQQQSPPPPDPVQAKMMKFLPLFFLFLFSSFAAGLVIYWSWSNTLTILQQWYIKHKHADKKAAA